MSRILNRSSWYAAVRLEDGLTKKRLTKGEALKAAKDGARALGGLWQVVRVEHRQTLVTTIPRQVFLAGGGR